MTEAEAREKSGVVVAALFPNWWMPGEICSYTPRIGSVSRTALCGEKIYGGSGWYQHGPHEIPPPNLLEPNNFDRALAAILPKYAVVFSRSEDGRRHCELWTPRPRRIETNAENHREAFLLALLALVTREAKS